MSKKKRKLIRRDQGRSMMAQHQEISYSGPLPPPAHLEQYDKVLPGAAERIMTMAEQQSLHRRELESKVIDSGRKNSGRGLNYGLIIGLSGFAVVAYCAYLGQEILAGSVAFLDLASLVGVFVYGSKTRSEEREKKEKAVMQDK